MWYQHTSAKDRQEMWFLESTWLPTEAIQGGSITTSKKNKPGMQLGPWPHLDEDVGLNASAQEHPNKNTMCHICFRMNLRGPFSRWCSWL